MEQTVRQQVGGPLDSANAEIRRHMQQATMRQQEKAAIERPFRNIDRLIARMERLHLHGFTELPRNVVQELHSLQRELPPEVIPPRRWRHRIADAIDQLFELEEKLLRLRYPNRLLTE
jgi:hypothetical protein